MTPIDGGVRVICVNVGDKYGVQWVHKLQRMVDRHLTVPHQFICMSDLPILGHQCVKAPEGLEGWWAKVGLFQPGRFPGLNLYLDLDVVITGNIDSLVEDVEPGYLYARDDFSYSLINPRRGMSAEQRRYLGGPGTVQSSVMVWRDDAGADVWNEFTPAKTREVHGDQNWITQAMWPDRIKLLPNHLISSYKYHKLRGQTCGPVMVFHGDPKVTDLPATDPLRRAWSA